jgi:glycosyltransferase involved in cell wall biosynthesis
VKKILIVAMADSVHTARWLRQFDDEEIEFVLFPSTPHRRIHPLISDHGLKTVKSKITISKWMKRGGLPLGVLDLLLDNRIRARLLAKLITTFGPDLIHLMETQHSGYLTDRALSAITHKPRLLLSIWGSDLFWFQRFPKHQRKIRSVLKKVDLLVVECRRDQNLALDLGYQGKFVDVMPATGGLETSRLKQLALNNPPSQRKQIAVKGYSGFVGLGRDGLKVIVEIEDRIKDFSVMVYSAGLGTWWLSRRLRKSMGKRIIVARKHTLSNSEIEQMFLRSRVAIGLSLSDGLPATVKEAMCTGVFPVQTNTSCAGEWFDADFSGLLVPPNDVSAAAKAVLRAINDDQLVDSAMNRNLTISEKRFSEVNVGEMSRKIYLDSEIFKQ